MASRIAVRYIPWRFSSNSRNLIDLQGKVIDQSFSFVNQTTVKPPTTTNHQWRPKSDPICREEFNHLQKRVNRVKERSHGIQKNLSRGVEKSGSTKIAAIKGVEQKLKELEKTVKDLKSREELAYQEKVKEIGLTNQINRGFEERVKKVEDVVEEALTNRADFTCRQIEASDLINKKFDEKVREAEKILKEGEKQIAIQVLRNQKDLILEHQKFEQKRKEAEKTLEEWVSNSCGELKLLRDKIYREKDANDLESYELEERVIEFEKVLRDGEKIANQILKSRQDLTLEHQKGLKEAEEKFAKQESKYVGVTLRLKEFEEGAKEFEKKLKEGEKIAIQVFKDRQDSQYQRLKFEERVKEVEKLREEGAKEFEKKLKEGEKIAIQVFKDRQDSQYQRLKFEERVKEVEKLREEGAKEFEKNLREGEKIASQVLKDQQDMAYKRVKFEERVKEAEKQQEDVVKLLKVCETFANQVSKSREDLKYREKEANDLERMNFVPFQESIKKVEERMDKFEQKVAAMYRNPCVYMMYGAGVYATAFLLDHII
ncbi:putative golgin subfamily A member 6-like protein 3 [Papaver somniferum]|uniref:putative golgin subfamily A member 6-like protein 3 n=1 Tax=Papaver somniferum TaxID=3469 RepID=UPI000E6FB8F9|nr:putative golgin subfamily A member 6-like protein 3 [Papaver somniferum]